MSKQTFFCQRHGVYKQEVYCQDDEDCNKKIFCQKCHNHQFKDEHQVGLFSELEDILDQYFNKDQRKQMKIELGILRKNIVQGYEQLVQDLESKVLKLKQEIIQEKQQLLKDLDQWSQLNEWKSSVSFQEDQWLQVARFYVGKMKKKQDEEDEQKEVFKKKNNSLWSQGNLVKQFKKEINLLIGRLQKQIQNLVFPSQELNENGLKKIQQNYVKMEYKNDSNTEMNLKIDEWDQNGQLEFIKQNENRILIKNKKMVKILEIKENEKKLVEVGRINQNYQKVYQEESGKFLIGVKNIAEVDLICQKKVKILKNVKINEFAWSFDKKPFYSQGFMVFQSGQEINVYQLNALKGGQLELFFSIYLDDFIVKMYQEVLCHKNNYFLAFICRNAFHQNNLMLIELKKYSDYRKQIIQSNRKKTPCSKQNTLSQQKQFSQSKFLQTQQDEVLIDPNQKIIIQGIDQQNFYLIDLENVEININKQTQIDFSMKFIPFTELVVIYLNKVLFLYNMETNKIERNLLSVQDTNFEIKILLLSNQQILLQFIADEDQENSFEFENLKETTIDYIELFQVVQHGQNISTRQTFKEENYFFIQDVSQNQKYLLKVEFDNAKQKTELKILQNKNSIF